MEHNLLSRDHTSEHAWQIAAPGGPESLVCVMREIPSPGPGQVRIRNLAIGLNPVDWKLMSSGHPDWHWPHVPGVDGAGIVEAMGEGVRVPIGARVAYHTDLRSDGSFAESTLVPAKALIFLPAGMDMIAAATLPCPGLTAWQALAKLPFCSNGTGPIQLGDDILITAASGAVGGYLVQLASKRGLKAHALGSPSEHLRLKGLGAASVHDYRANWRETLRISLGERPLFAAIDAISGEHASALAPLLTANGHLVAIQDRVESPPVPPFTTSVSLHEVALAGMHLHGDNRQWSRLVQAGQNLAIDLTSGGLTPQVIEVAGFEDLPASLHRLQQGPNPGNRVVQLQTGHDCHRRTTFGRHA